MLIALIILTSLTLVIALLGLTKKTTEPQQDIEPRLRQLTEQTSLLQSHLQSHLSEHLMKSFDILRGQIIDTLKQNAEQTDKQVKVLTEQTNQRLKEISGQVEKRLSEGFEKTTATFHDIIKRLALIDEAQKKITELSSNVVSLQQVLADKRSRGAFGEVQLSQLVRNVLPEPCFSLQHTFGNNVRADCVLFLPEPTGNICIDAKFPLESYQTMANPETTDPVRHQATRQFKQDIKKHINDIANKYIITNETADGAIMFIPAEAVFAEIHAHHPELVELAQQSRVWLASPTTLMAILTTIRAVIKDDETRTQVHIIQKHLKDLNNDFGRFQERMNKLAKHIEMAHDDVGRVNISAQKISSRFEKIENVDLSLENNKPNQPP